MLGTIEDNDYYDQQPSGDNTSAQNFFNLVNLILQEKRSNENSSIEQKYQDQQPDLPNGPKLAEVPEYEDIPLKELLSSLDFNPKLLESQRAQLGKIILLGWMNRRILRHQVHHQAQGGHSPNIDATIPCLS